MAPLEESHEVIVAGLGAWGSAALSHLARRGVDVLGLDAGRPPHRHGSHHGDGRVIRMASPESPAYAPLMRRAYGLWRELEHDARTSLLTTPGAISAGPEGHTIVTGALASYEAGDVPHEVLDARRAERRFSWLTLASDEVAVFEPSGGVLRPEAAIAAQLGRAAHHGATVRVGEAVLEWGGDDDGVRVATARATYRAERLVLAVGVAAPEHLRCDLPLDVERQVVAVYAADTERLGITPFAVPSEHGECFYGLPEGPARVKVGVYHGGLLGQGGEDFLEEVVGEDLELIGRYVGERLPVLDAGPLTSYTCRYTNTPDLHFVLGPHPSHPNVVIASGDSGHGFKLAPAIGEALGDLVQGRKREDLELFQPRRFARSPT